MPEGTNLLQVSDRPGRLRPDPLDNSRNHFISSERLTTLQIRVGEAPQVACVNSCEKSLDVSKLGFKFAYRKYGVGIRHIQNIEFSESHDNPFDVLVVQKRTRFPSYHVGGFQQNSCSFLAQFDRKGELRSAIPQAPMFLSTALRACEQSCSQNGKNGTDRLRPTGGRCTSQCLRDAVPSLTKPQHVLWWQSAHRRILYDTWSCDGLSDVTASLGHA